METLKCVNGNTITSEIYVKCDYCGGFALKEYFGVVPSITFLVPANGSTVAVCFNCVKKILDKNLLQEKVDRKLD